MKMTSDAMKVLRAKYGDDNGKIISELVASNTGISTIAICPVYDDDGSASGAAVLTDIAGGGSTTDKGIQVTGGMAVLMRDFLNASNIAMVKGDSEMLSTIMELHEVFKDYAKENHEALKKASVRV